MMQLNKIGKREQFFSWIMFVLPAITGFFNIPGQFLISSGLFILIGLSYCTKKTFRRQAMSFPLLVWLSLTLYHWVNARYKHVPGVDFADLMHGLKVYFCLMVVLYWASLDFSKTIRLLLRAYLLRCFFVLFLLVAGGYSGGRLTGAGGSATGLGQMAALIGIYIAYSNCLKKISIEKNVMLYFLPFLIVVLSLSRNSLAMLCISIVACFFAYNRRRNKQVYVRGLFLLGVLFLAVLTALPFLENTTFVKRAANTKDTFEQGYFHKHNATGTVFDKIVGDRLVYYVNGWSFFKANPLTGIGMWNYKAKTGGYYPLHSEYMVHICEGGLVAIGLWLTFVGYVIWNLLRIEKKNPLKNVAFLSITVLLFCGIYAREFFHEMFYPTYALALCLINQSKYNKEIKYEKNFIEIKTNMDDSN